MEKTFYLQGTKLPSQLYNKYEWKDDILHLYFEKYDTLSKEDIIKTKKVPTSDNKELQKLIDDIRKENYNSITSFLVKDNDGMEKKFLHYKMENDILELHYRDREGTKISKEDVVNVMKIPKKEIIKKDVTSSNIILDNLLNEIKNKNKSMSLGESTEWYDYRGKDPIILYQENAVTVGKHYFYSPAGSTTGKVEITKITDDSISFKFVDKNKEEVINIDNDSRDLYDLIIKGGKRKTRRNRKSKKGKRSRKARKSRRKSNRRRGRR